MFRLLTDYAEQVKYIQPIMQSLGSDIPAQGNGVIFAQFDGEEVVAFQILQMTLLAEGMYAKDGRAHLRTLCNMMLDHLRAHGGSGRQLLTMTRGDAQGQRIGKAAKYMGFAELDWKVYRRTV